MRIELVSFALCPFVHRVATLLHEKSVDFTVRYIDLKNKPDWFLAISPRGRVPVLVVDDRPLFESAALLEFVDETQGPRLLPEDPFARARQRAFISFGADVFLAQYKLVIARNDEELEAARTALVGQLDAFEQALGDGPFFDGQRFGLVDAALAPALQRLVFIEERVPGFDGFGALAKCRRWARRVAEQPSVRRGLPPDFDGLFVEALKAGALGRRMAAA